MQIDVEYLRAWLMHKLTKRDMSLCLLEILRAVANGGLYDRRTGGDEESWGSDPAHSLVVRQIFAYTNSPTDSGFGRRQG